MSDKVRVFEIAEEAASTSAEVMQKAKELGIDLKTAQATVSYEDAEEITQYIMTGKSSRIKEPVEEKVAKPKKGEILKPKIIAGTAAIIGPINGIISNIPANNASGSA